MQFAEEHYRSAKKRAEQRLFCIPGVVGVAVGPKIVSGKLTSIPAIQVYVKKKRPPADVQPQHVIPASIEGVATDVLEGTFPVEMSATVRCRNGKISDATTDANGLVEITSTDHGLSDGKHVRTFGVPLTRDAGFPVTVKDKDVFTLPSEVQLAGALLGFAFWTEVCSFEDGLCCCPTGQITEAVAGKRVKITSPSHGLQGGDRIKVAKITAMTQLLGKELTVGKTTKDTFELRGIDGTNFTTGGPGQESGQWEKLCVDRSGRIQKVKMGAPVVFTSQGHSLNPKDRVHIITLSDDLKISSWDKAEPFTVATVNGDTFTVQELANVGPVQETAIIGCWIRILPDGRMYSRARGGIRIAMDKDEVVGAPPLINTASASSGTVINFTQTVTVRTTITYGTLGCLAIENGTNRKVLVSNYHVLYSVDEDNVHHPDYSACKSHKIAERMRHADGGTQAAPTTADAAIAKLRYQSKADPVIVDIGDVRGTASLTLQDIVVEDPSTSVSFPLGYRVRKRGITTLVTEGVVIGLDGTFHDPDAGVPIFSKNQIIIEPMAGDGLGAFTLKGDSGSALVNDDNKIVGLVCGGDGRGRGYASPIADVENLLNIKVMEVPTSTPVTGGAPSDDVVIIPSVPDLLAAVMSEAAASPGGAHLVSIVMGHHREVEHLVHHNRRVTVAWHRNAGPSILRELHELVVRRDVALPEQVEGLSVRRCIENFFDSLRQCGSVKLAADVEQYAHELLSLSSLTYTGMLETLAARGEAPRA